LSPEWHQRELYQLEMLSGEGYSNDGNGEEEGENEMHQRGVQAAAEQPNDITKKIDAPHAMPRGHDLLAERPKHQPRKLETLHPKWDPDHRQAKHKPTDNVPHRGKESATDQPYKVSYKIHWLKIPIFQNNSLSAISSNFLTTLPLSG
jgi:hypothetical protein